jgi:hypothetical protein
MHQRQELVTIVQNRRIFNFENLSAQTLMSYKEIWLCQRCLRKLKTEEDLQDYVTSVPALNSMLLLLYPTKWEFHLVHLC